MRKSLCILTLVSLLTACAPAAGSTPTVTAWTPSPVNGLYPTENETMRFEWQRLVEGIEAQGVSDPEVLRAMSTVPRHAFVPPEYLDQAYYDHALPIGYGQTISQPFVVAWMTELLELKPGEKVLEIGTGSGYQAAILAELGYVEVYSIEIVPELADIAAARLQELGYPEVRTRQGDGYYGWPEYAPFDAIIVTAAPDHLPAPLAAQLAEGGRLVIPIGPPGWFQSLWKFVKEEGELTAYNMGGVGFVPLTGPGVEQYEPEETPTP
jgi:protein-L-isoaspartate(D-aspartate) O-methyltransferase